MLNPITKLINRSWKRHRVRISGRKRAGISVDGLFRISRARNSQLSHTVLDNWLVIYDEFASWMVSFTLVLFRQFVEPEQKEKLIVPLLLLSSSIVSMLLSIRTLVDSGFDVPAKQILRSLCEYADVLCLLVIRPELVEEFMETDDLVKSNRFWHKHITKGKARREIDKIWGRFVQNEQEFGQMVRWRTEEMTVLSAAPHPSKIAAFASTALMDGDETKPIEWLTCFGSKGHVSIRTLSFAIHVVGDILLVTHDLLYGDKESDVALLHFDPNDLFDRHVRRGRITLLELLMLITECHDAPELSSKPSPDARLKEFHLTFPAESKGGQRLLGG